MVTQAYGAALDLRVERLGALVDAVIEAATAEGWARSSDILVAAPPVLDADGTVLRRGLLVDRDGDRLTSGQVRALTRPARRALGLRRAEGVRHLPVRQWEYDSAVWVQRSHWREHLEAEPTWCDLPLPDDPAEVVDAVRGLYARAGTRSET